MNLKDNIFNDNTIRLAYCNGKSGFIKGLPFSFQKSSGKNRFLQIQKDKSFPLSNLKKKHKKIS